MGNALQRNAILIAKFDASNDPKEREVAADEIRRKFGPTAIYHSRHLKDDYRNLSGGIYVNEIVAIFRKKDVSKNAYNYIRKMAKYCKTISGSVGD